MAEFITWLGSICSIIGVSISLIGEKQCSKIPVLQEERQGYEGSQAVRKGNAMV